MVAPVAVAPAIEPAAAPTLAEPATAVPGPTVVAIPNPGISSNQYVFVFYKFHTRWLLVKLEEKGKDGNSLNMILKIRYSMKWTIDISIPVAPAPTPAVAELATAAPVTK